MLQSPARTGLLIMVLVTIGGAADSVIVRLLAGEIPAMQIGFTRALFGVLALLPLILRRPAILRTSARWSHVLRAGLKLLSLVLLFAALQRAPLATVTAIGFASPLFVALGAWQRLAQQLAADHGQAADRIGRRLDRGGRQAVVGAGHHAVQHMALHGALGDAARDDLHGLGCEQLAVEAEMPEGGAGRAGIAPQPGSREDFRGHLEGAQVELHVPVVVAVAFPRPDRAGISRDPRLAAGQPAQHGRPPSGAQARRKTGSMLPSASFA
nr:DMT family transporter [Mangrovicoccus ximenensis]